MMRWPLAFLLTLGSACASTTRIQVRSQPATNDGRALYLLVREVPSGEEVVVEGYEQAARRVFSREPATGRQERRAIIPGTPLTVDFETKGEGDVVLYFFFTEPGDDWWRTIDKKRLPAEIVVELGLDEIESIGVRGR